MLPNPRQAAPTLLNHALKLDEQIVDALLGQGGLDRRLAPFCSLVAPMETGLSPRCGARGTVSNANPGSGSGSLLGEKVDRGRPAARHRIMAVP